MCCAGDIPAAAYTGVAIWGVGSIPLQLHSQPKPATPADPSQDPKTAPGLAASAAVTPSTRWLVIPAQSEVLDLTQTDAVRPSATSIHLTGANTVIPRRISFGQPVHGTSVTQRVATHATAGPALVSPGSAKQAEAQASHQQQSDVLLPKKIRSKRKATLNSSEASQQTGATGDTEHQGQESGRAVKRSRHSLRKLNEHSEMSDAAPASA